MFLKISQISQESTCVGVSFDKVTDLQACNLIKQRLYHSLFDKVSGLQASNLIKQRFQDRCFSIKFAKLLRVPFFTEQVWWLLLSIVYCLFVYCLLWFCGPRQKDLYTCCVVVVYLAEKFPEKTQKREYIHKMIGPFKESASITETSGLSFHETYFITCLETGEYFKF